MTVSITLSDLCYRNIVNEVSVGWSQGQVVGVVGPNGAGKSTLLRLLTGIWQPTSGTIHVNGKALCHLSARSRAREIAYLPQHVPENIAFTVEQYVEMGRFAYRTSRGQLTNDSRRAVLFALESLNLLEQRHTPMHFLSGGEQQRAGIARCIAQGSSILVLDEPISSLDLFYQVDILKRLQDLAAEGYLVVLAIHNLELAARYCSDLLLLWEGAVRAQGSPEDVLTEKSLQEVFQVEVKTFVDPYVGHLRLTHFL